MNEQIEGRRKVSMLGTILIVIAVLVVLFVLVVATRPANFRVERSATMNAPPEEVFAQVNDLHKWEAWNPWGKLDPDMEQTYEGPPFGVGSSYSWVGNKNVGEGRMTIAESRPNDLILIELEFFKPFAATHTTEFTFQPVGESTKVTWAMFGENNFMAKAMGLFMSMDKMIGGMFEKGLADLKAIVEGKS
jgi:uncharacterized protein YndB with AHSA1/START domain